MPISRHSLLRTAFAGALALTLGACVGSGTRGPAASGPQTPPADAIGQGSVRAALILPLTAGGNAGNVAHSMRNAAEMALAEFNNPNIQLIVKDDGGTGPGATAAAQSAIAEGAEIILGPLFAPAVSAAGQVARQSGVPVIAFSTDANVAARGVYLLSFLPQSDVQRIISYAAQNGRRSFAALLPDNAYGTVVQGAFQEAVSSVGGRVVAIERYPANVQQIQGPISRIAQVAGQADALFVPDGGAMVPQIAAGLAAARVDTSRMVMLGTGQWDDPRVFREAAMRGAFYPAPESAAYQAFAGRYRARYGADPARTATLAYDAVLLAAALTQTQGSQRFSESALTNPSGFQGIDGIFRFRTDGLNERGLAVLQVEPGGGRTVNPAPRSFGGAPGI